MSPDIMPEILWRWNIGLLVLLSWVTVQVREYRKLHVLEFDSTRKRMSVVVRYPSGRVLLVTKGAESSVLPRCVTGTQSML